MSDLKPTLHHLNDSQSQRILWLLEELEIPYNLALHKRQETGPKAKRAPEELKQTHFLGKAPQLETGDGRVIVESLVVAKYLIQTYDKEGKFKCNGDWIRDEELSNLAATTIGSLTILELVFSLLEQASPWFIRPLLSTVHAKMHSAFTGPELDLNFTYLEKQLGDQDYFGGAFPSQADFIISWPMDQSMARNLIDVEKHASLAKWYERIHERPAWKRSSEKGNGYSLGL
ncbi:hypothetical protein PV11_00186 [Exophiala sideris]|uniref:GST N-terminal domain-containing protein n=1 Tax=Exophiala sideris TaxID=1016849 RepID=A0A0D1ZCB2_9EURO|nr:hypothetical protein PV11_00186 [Exophiala sideris]